MLVGSWGRVSVSSPKAIEEERTHVLAHPVREPKLASGKISASVGLMWPNHFMKQGALFVEIGRPAWGVIVPTEFDAPHLLVTVDDRYIDSVRKGNGLVIRMDVGVSFFTHPGGGSSSV